MHIEASGYMTQNCFSCGKTYNTAYPKQLFCSARCQETFKTKLHIEASSRYMTQNCFSCGKTYNPAYPKQLFCSARCQETFRTKWGYRGMENDNNDR